MKKIVQLSVVFAFTGLIISCGSEPEDDMAVLNQPTETKNDKAEAFPEDALYDIINEIPSPLEISKLIHESGAMYNEQILNDVDNAGSYDEKYSQALNLGIYGTNLGYINMYSNYSSSVTYLSAIKSLSEELRVSQFFDFHTIKRLAQNSENIDSILHISTTGFEGMNNYLRSEGSDEISVLILVGGWVEALYILSTVAETSPSDELIERIGEQQMFLDDLLTIVSLYESHGYFNKIASDIEDLKSAYAGVKIEYTEGEQTTKVVDGVPVVEMSGSSKVVIDDATLKKITTRVKKIRSTLIEANAK